MFVIILDLQRVQVCVGGSVKGLKPWGHISPIPKQKCLRKNMQICLSSVQLYRRSLKFWNITEICDFPHKASVFCKRITTFLESLHFCSLLLPVPAVGFLFRAFALHGGGTGGQEQNCFDFIGVPVPSCGIRAIGSAEHMLVNHRVILHFSPVGNEVQTCTSGNHHMVWTSWISPKHRDCESEVCGCPRHIIFENIQGRFGGPVG